MTVPLDVVNGSASSAPEPFRGSRTSPFTAHDGAAAHAARAGRSRRRRARSPGPTRAADWSGCCPAAGRRLRRRSSRASSPSLPPTHSCNRAAGNSSTPSSRGDRPDRPRSTAVPHFRDIDPVSRPARSRHVVPWACCHVRVAAGTSRCRMPAPSSGQASRGPLSAGAALVDPRRCTRSPARCRSSTSGARARWRSYGRTVSEIADRRQAWRRPSSDASAPTDGGSSPTSPRCAFPAPPISSTPSTATSHSRCHIAGQQPQYRVDVATRQRPTECPRRRSRAPHPRSPPGRNDPPMTTDARRRPQPVPA